MKIPSEIDALMWEVAEANSIELMDQFGRRYPEYRQELVKRIHMVRGLKGARPEEAPKPEKKGFEPSTVIREPHWSTRLLPVGVGILVLASVSFATYSIITYVSSRKPVATEAPVEQTIPNWDTPVNEPVVTEPTTPENAELENQTWINGVPPAEAPTPPLETKVTVRIQGATLTEVLMGIAAQAGISIQQAPGMPNPEIVAMYTDMPAIMVLNDLGRHFKFTALAQGERQVLLVPAVDQAAPPTEGATGSGGYASTYPPANGGSSDSSGANQPLTGPIGR